MWSKNLTKGSLFDQLCHHLPQHQWIETCPMLILQVTTNSSRNFKLLSDTTRFEDVSSMSSQTCCLQNHPTHSFCFPREWVNPCAINFLQQCYLVSLLSCHLWLRWFRIKFNNFKDSVFLPQMRNIIFIKLSRVWNFCTFTTFFFYQVNLTIWAFIYKSNFSVFIHIIRFR